MKKSVRGDKQKRFDFLSEAGLTVGQEYLVYFSKEDAKIHRYAAYPVNTKESLSCDVQIRGYLLMYNELHPVQEIWNGKHLIRAVNFNDAWANDVKGPGFNKTTHFVELDYIEGELSKR